MHKRELKPVLPNLGPIKNYGLVIWTFTDFDLMDFLLSVIPLKHNLETRLENNSTDFEISL